MITDNLSVSPLFCQINWQCIAVLVFKERLCSSLTLKILHPLLYSLLWPSIWQEATQGVGGVYLSLQLEATFHHSGGGMAEGAWGCFSHLDRSQKDNTGAQVAFSFPPFHSFQDLALGGGATHIKILSQIHPKLYLTNVLGISDSNQVNKGNGLSQFSSSYRHDFISWG